VKLAVKLCYDSRLIIDIENEIRLQIEKLLKFKHFDHIDSHRHIHYIPQIFKIVNHLAEEYNINRIRIPVPRITKNNIKFIFYRKKFYLFFPFYIWKIFNKNNSSSTDDFFGLFQTGNLDDKYLNYIKEVSEYHYAELTVHPGYVDDILLNQTDDHLLFSRERELNLLKKHYGFV